MTRYAAGPLHTNPEKSAIAFVLIGKEPFVLTNSSTTALALVALLLILPME